MKMKNGPLTPSPRTIIVGIGFTLIENVEFALSGSGNLLRAFLPGHILYQFFMGYFYGKARVTGEKKYDVLSLVVPILAHAVFDMPIIALIVATGDMNLDNLTSADVEAIMQLPYFGYFIPLLAFTIAVMVAMLVGLIAFAKTMNSWSKKGKKQELLQKVEKNNCKCSITFCKIVLGDGVSGPKIY